MTPPRVVPDPRRWPHPLTALRRWARRWLGVHQDNTSLVMHHRARWNAHLDHHKRCDDHLVEAFGIVAERLDKLDAEVARLKGTTGAIGDRYPNDGRRLRPFRRVTGEGS